jgi:redox-sensing transcriptional repressor
MISGKNIERLSLYRRIVLNMERQGIPSVYSHQLAAQAGCTPAQVRRDLMAVGYSGNTKKGYDLGDLIRSINDLLGPPRSHCAALVGVGNLGRALLSHFSERRHGLHIEAAFDRDESKVGYEIQGCPCYPVELLDEVIARHRIRVGILCVPAREAQEVARVLIAAGVRGVMNFAPTRLVLPKHIYVESIDMTIASEKVAYFADQIAREEAASRSSGSPSAESGLQEVAAGRTDVEGGEDADLE